MAGKAKRNAAKEKRRAMKRARKATQKALYKQWTEAGQNSKRSKLRRARKRSVRTHRHRISYCGNPGCSKCFPEIAMKREGGRYVPCV